MDLLSLLRDDFNVANHRREPWYRVGDDRQRGRARNDGRFRAEPRAYLGGGSNAVDRRQISAPNFRKHVAQYASVQELALQSNEVILAQTQITAACNALHNIEQRFCRWLLQTWDRSENDTITLTQEFLSEMLGVRRTSVTEIASKMQAEGLIRYRRGLIEVLNQPGLEQRACDCYHAVRHAERTIMGMKLGK